MKLNLCKWLGVPVFTVAAFLFAADAPSAHAQYGYFGRGGFGISIGGYGSHHFHHGNHYPLYRSFYAPTYRSHYYHDTSHWDYHPTEIRRHGNHYHVIPGHYDYHRTGHWHH